MAQDTSNYTFGSVPHPIGQKGGEENCLLTVREMPTHSHNLYIRFGGGSGPSNSSNIQGSQNSGNGENTTPAGDNKPHNNMPPFYTLVYIMKL
jgi:microcystin-dependent protein